MEESNGKFIEGTQSHPQFDDLNFDGQVIKTLRGSQYLSQLICNWGRPIRDHIAAIVDTLNGQERQVGIEQEPSAIFSSFAWTRNKENVQ
jgi:hypothetical protein